MKPAETGAERCLHDFDPGQCALCKPSTPAPRRPPADRPAEVINARYDGWCPACREEIYAGDPITYDDETDRWVHEECT